MEWTPPLLNGIMVNVERLLWGNANGRNGSPEAIRVCLGGTADRGDTRHALEIIADTLEELPVVASHVM